MAAAGPAGPEMRGEDGDPSRGDAPEPTRFDLGDSRDLAAAVKAVWRGSERPAPAVVGSAVPRPPLTRGVAAVATNSGADPLAHLRGEAVRTRRRPRLALPVRLQTMRRSTLVASVAAGVAVLLAAAVPVFGEREPRPLIRVADERPTSTTSAPRRTTTTAFTYPPETLVPVETTAPPPVAATAGPAIVGPPATAAPTATTSRPRTTTTRRPSPTTTRPAPTTTTTQPPPPPPPDDGGGSSDPPPYP